MLKKEQISNKQMTALVLMLIFGDMLLVYPSVITSYAKKDAWICSLLGIPLGMLLMLLFLKISVKNPNQNIIQICRNNFGSGFGTFISCMYLYYFAMSASWIVRGVGDFVNTQLYPYTPVQIIMLLLMLPMVWTLLQGIENLGRICEFLTPIVFFCVIIFILSLIPQFKIDNMLPMLTGNKYISLAEGIIIAALYPVGEIIPILMLIPYMSMKGHYKKDIILISGLGTLILSLVVMISLSVLGPFLTQHNNYPTFALAQKINIGGFFNRIEAIIACAWIISTYIKAIVYLFAFIVGISELFGLRQYKFLILPSSLFIFGLGGFIIPNMIFSTKTIGPYWVEFDATICIVIPIILFVIDKLRTKNKIKQENE